MLSYKVFFVILILFLVGGCSNSGSIFSSGSSGSDDVSDPFEGNEGLVLSFIEGSPPGDVYQDTNFQVSVEVHNRGALDVTRGVARLGALSTRFVVDEGNTRTFEDIRGKLNFPDFGDMELVDWDNINAKQTSVRRDTNQNLNVQVCYEGRVEANPEVCVRPRPGSAGIISGERNVGKNAISGGQGGPIAVTSVIDSIVKETNDENKIRYVIEVRDVGGGNVINRGELVTNCLPSDREKNDANVGFEIGWVGETAPNFKCKFNNKDEEGNSGNLVVRNGLGRIICDSPSVPNDNHYSLPLYIKMNYGYISTIKKSFTLKKDVFSD